MVARTQRPHAVLFACRFNAIRSPMAESMFKHLFGARMYCRSTGVRKGEVDAFAGAVMEEIGLDIAKHRPHTFEELDDWEGLNFDLIITMAPEAHHKALDLTRAHPIEVEYWPIPDPSDVDGNREQKLAAYRHVRDLILNRIKERFGWQPGGGA